MASASAVGISMLQRAGSKLGMESGGKCEGSEPTVATSPPAALNAMPARLPATMATIMKGMRGRKCLTAMPVASVISPVSAVARLAWPMWAAI